MDTKFKSEFAAAPREPWVTLDSGNIAGSVRTAGSSGNVTFLEVFAAGWVKLGYMPDRLIVNDVNWLGLIDRHMVPFDQAENALVCTDVNRGTKLPLINRTLQDMITRWVAGVPLTLNVTA